MKAANSKAFTCKLRDNITHSRHFIAWEHQYGGGEVTWKRSIHKLKLGPFSCHDITLGARGFSCAVSGFGQVLKSDPREKPLDQSAIPLIAQITTPLIPKHPESACFADWFLGDIKRFKCSDWITITIGTWSERQWFEGDKDQIQTIQAHITYVFTFWKRIENMRCLYERKISIRQ